MQDSEKAPSESIAQTTLTSIGDAVLVTDAQGRVTLLNPVAERLTGWKTAEAQGIASQQVFALFQEETREAVENPVDRVLREGTRGSIATHTILRRRDGTEIPIEDSASPVRDDQGNLVGVVLVFRDISERRAIETALRESEKRFRLLVESATEFAMFLIDPEGKIASWNAGAQRILGYEDSEILGQPVALIFTPEDRANGIPERELARADREGRASDVRWHVRKDGSRFWADGVMERLTGEDGGFDGFAKVLRDATESKRAQDALRTSETQLRDTQTRLEVALSAGDIATWTFDIAQRRVLADANLSRLFGIETDAAANGEPGVYLNAIHSDDRTRVTRVIARMLKNPEQYEVEYRIAVPDGSHRWHVARGRVERNVSGQAVTLPGVVADITERVERERRERFLAELSERARTLADPDAIIQDAVRSIGQFFQVSRCTYGDLDLAADTCTIPFDYCADDAIVSLVGTLPISAFGSYLSTDFQAGLPIVVNDVRDPSAPVPPEFVAQYEALNIRSFIGMPVVHSARLVSVIALHHAEPRQWKPEEVELLRNAVERTWLTVELTRKQRVLQETVERESAYLTDLFMRAPAFMAALRGPKHVFELANPPYYQLVGHRDILGKPVAEALPEIVEQGFIDLLDQVYRSGEPFLGRDVRILLQVEPDGPLEERFLDFTYQPLLDESGAVSGILAHGIDLTDRKRLELERESLLTAAQNRADREALLNRIGTAVRATLEPDAIIQAAVDALGQGLKADRCYFVRYNQTRDTGFITREWFREGAGLEPIAGRSRPTSRYSVNRDAAFQAGRTQVVNDTTANGPEAAAPLLALNVHALLRVPIEVGNQMTAIGVAMADGPRDWTEDDVLLVENVAILVRSALESAHTQQRERTIAQQLQDALQPLAPGHLPGLALASFYRPALEEAGVGGDGFDVFAVAEDCTALCVFDLSGKGLKAASAVATVRNMARFALYNSSNVAEAINTLNRTLVDHHLLDGFATLFLGAYDHRERTLTYANCGQEPGLIWRAATGTVDQLPPTGPVLGGFIADAFTETAVTLAPGDIVVLFTDGMTEVGQTRRAFLEIEGLSSLVAQYCARASESAMTAPEIATTIVNDLIAGVEAHAGGAAAIRDDIALLVGVVPKGIP